MVHQSMLLQDIALIELDPTNRAAMCHRKNSWPPSRPIEENSNKIFIHQEDNSYSFSSFNWKSEEKNSSFMKVSTISLVSEIPWLLS